MAYTIVKKKRGFNGAWASQAHIAQVWMLYDHFFLKVLVIRLRFRFTTNYPITNCPISWFALNNHQSCKTESFLAELSDIYEVILSENLINDNLNPSPLFRVEQSCNSQSSVLMLCGNYDSSTLNHLLSTNDTCTFSLFQIVWDNETLVSKKVHETKDPSTAHPPWLWPPVISNTSNWSNICQQKSVR